MIITIDYQPVTVPHEIVRYCDSFTLDATREDLRYLDCVYMHMGLYGNDSNHLRQMRMDHPPVKKIWQQTVEELSTKPPQGPVLVYYTFSWRDT